MKNKNIFIIGPMGAGKTTVGKLLAKKIRYDFYDSDHEIEKKTGVSIATIFDYEGEEGFRKREIDVIERITRKNKIVLSSGGGAVVSTENCYAFRERGIIVYLRASIETQLKRTDQRKENRPLLAIDNPVNKIIELDEIRSPLYEKIAHHVFDTDDKSAIIIVDEIYHTIFEKFDH